MATNIDGPCVNGDYRKIKGVWSEFTNTSYKENLIVINEVIKPTTKCFKLYWLDIVEYTKSRPGLLYVFGKTYSFDKGQFVSCALAIKYVHQRFYLLPRKYFLSKPTRKVTYKDVVNEFCTVLGPAIEVFDCNFATVSKKYAFDEEIPFDTEYIEVKCRIGTFKYVNGEGDTYSKILGSSVSYTNTLLLERGIRGPGWLSIENYQFCHEKTTNCDIEIMCTEIDDIYPENISTTPEIRLLTLDFQMIHDKLDDGMTAASCSMLFEDIFCINEDSQVNRQYTIVLSQDIKHSAKTVRKRIRNTEIECVFNESNFFVEILRAIGSYNPDIIYGFEIQKTIEYLYSKIISHNLQESSRTLSKIISTQLPSHDYMMDLVSGRVLCDIKKLAPGLVKSRSFTLEELTKDILKLPHYTMPINEMKICLNDLAETTPLIVTNSWSAACIHKLLVELKIIPLIFEITNLCGNTLNKSCEGLPSKKSESLLLHVFHNENYIIPDSHRKEEITGFEGGLVLAPKIGLYKDFVLAMDFDALYPSIIMEYDVCFTTMNKNGDIITRFTQNGEIVKGVIPRIVKQLVQIRRDVIKKMPEETPKEREILEIKQQVIKMITNSLYGYLSCNGSRFYGPHLSAFITSKGREILKNAVEVVENKSYSVIYGDTDSIMVKTGLTNYYEAFTLRAELMTAINSQYTNIVISGAGMYKPFYSIKKKKYAGVNYLDGETTKKDIKGIELVRRDWSAVSGNIAKYILNLILTGNQNITDTIYNYLSKKQTELQDNYKNYSIDLFSISKKLSKHPNDYDAGIFDHIKVAKRYNLHHSPELKEGDFVTYVVCKDGTNDPPSERVYHIEEFANSNSLEIDIDYYIWQQIYPVVVRLCEPLLEIAPSDIERALGCFDSPGDDKEEQPQAKKPKLEEPKPKERVYEKTKYLRLSCPTCDDEVIVQYKDVLFFKRCNDCPATDADILSTRIDCILNYLLYNFKISKLKLTDIFDISFRLKKQLIQMDILTFLDKVDAVCQSIIEEANYIKDISINEICDEPNIPF